MPSMLLNLKCQYPACGGLLHKPDLDGRIICSVCGREHTENGQLLIPEVKYFADYSDRTPQQGIDNRR